MKAEILTPWTGDGSEGNANRPLVADDYTVTKWEDITAQPAENLQPNPNLYSVLIEADEAVITRIRLNPAYWVAWYG